MTHHGPREYQKPRPKQTMTRRTCLRCDRAFLSEGNHHRLCTTCRQVLTQEPTSDNARRLPRPWREWR